MAKTLVIAAHALSAFAPACPELVEGLTPTYGVGANPTPPVGRRAAQGNRMNEGSLPFKGRVGVGMGFSGDGIGRIAVLFNPIPLLASPLKGEERSGLALMRLPWRAAQPMADAGVVVAQCLLSDYG